jgi:hypothetical protein
MDRRNMKNVENKKQGKKSKAADCCGSHKGNLSAKRGSDGVSSSFVSLHIGEGDRGQVKNL